MDTSVAAAAAAVQRHKAMWRERLEYDPKPHREHAHNDQQYALWAQRWYARRLYYEPALGAYVNERHRMSSDWMYGFMFATDYDGLKTSNHHVRELSRALVHYVDTHLLVHEKATQERRTAVLKHLQNACNAVCAEMDHCEQVHSQAKHERVPVEQLIAKMPLRERPKQELKHFFFFMCLVFYPPLLDWLCDGSPSENKPPPGVLDTQALRTWVRTFVHPLLQKCMQGVDNVVLNRVVFDCLTGYVADVGVARSATHTHYHWFLMSLARDPLVRREVDLYYAEKHAYVHEDKIYSQRLDAAQALYDRTQAEIERDKRQHNDTVASHDSYMRELLQEDSVDGEW